MTRAPLLLFLLVAARVAAQDPSFVNHTPRTDHLFPEEMEPAYVLGNDVALRAMPNVQGGLVSTLSAGSNVWLEERGADTLVVHGIGSTWYRVTTGKHEGWVWGGHIAQCAFGSTTDPTVKFVGGIDHITLPDTGLTDFFYRLVALRNDKELDRLVVRSFAWGFGMVQNLGNRGLKNVDDVITLEVPCVGGCGCTTGDVVVFWSGGKFHHVADLMGSPDGAYSSGSSFLYPADMEGVPGALIKVTSTYDDAPEETLEETNPKEIKRIVIREFLAWNGLQLVPSGRPTEELRYQMSLDEE
ncbi:MAG: hypothetical protein JNM31_12570 [Flavobacteriales bacterium]|nr:hypothetical protein [Flavobacteriales bacterium]